MERQECRLYPVAACKKVIKAARPSYLQHLLLYPITMNYAVILAGGTGSRVGGDVPKQLLVMGGCTVLEHSVGAFASHPMIHEVLIVCHPSTFGEVEGIISRRQASGEWLSVCRIVEGGSTRAASSLAGIRAVQELSKGDDSPCILFHDAARPLVSADIITRVCRTLLIHRVVNVGIPVVDTVVEYDGMRQTSVLDRSRLLRVQTPQGFHLHTIAEAYRMALADPAFTATDDCGIVMRYLPYIPVHVVEGDERNAKLTYASDIPMFEYLLKQKH